MPGVKSTKSTNAHSANQTRKTKMIFYNGFNLLVDMVLVAITILVTLQLKRR